MPVASGEGGTPGGIPAGRLCIETPRLRLTALDVDALQAWLDGDAEGLQAATGVSFSAPLETPPLFGHDLPMFRDRMAETPEELGWWVWLISLRDDWTPVGVCGLGGLPGVHGAVLLGYAVYPHREGCGYATEAARRLAEWVLDRAGVRCIRATIPARNERSMAVARKLGMVQVDTESHPELGVLAVFEVRRPVEGLERTSPPDA